MNESIVILGRQPKLGLAELESLYGSNAVHPLPFQHASPQVALLSIAPEHINFGRLGGSIKLARPVANLDTANWPKVEIGLQKAALQQIQSAPEGKIKLGLSLYGYEMSTARLNAIGLNLKKALRKTGRSVRTVPNKELQLNSAQIAHNGLTGRLGWELLVIRNGAQTIIAQTIAEQNIDAYAARDQGRPKRDARVGMLPPKLAQTIVNLATASTLPSIATPSTGADPTPAVRVMPPPTVLDPFCGTGVVLQEAQLMGFGVYGTDIEPRMIDFTATNLRWLQETYLRGGADTARPGATPPQLETGDATAHQWNPVPQFVACEGYLGQPFATFPGTDKLTEVRSTCNLILKKFLQNIGRQLPSGTRLCVAVPAWQQKPGVFVHLPLLDGSRTRGQVSQHSNTSAPGVTLDHLEEMGYNRISFKHVEPKDLIYARADQIVARELLVITKK